MFDLSPLTGDISDCFSSSLSQLRLKLQRNPESFVFRTNTNPYENILTYSVFRKKPALLAMFSSFYSVRKHSHNTRDKVTLSTEERIYLESKNNL